MKGKRRRGRIAALAAWLILAGAGCANTPEPEPQPEPDPPGITDRLAAAQRAVEANPQQAEAHYALGNALFDLGSYEPAAAAYGRAAELSPDFAKAHTNHGLALRRLGRLNDALTAYDRALAVEPRDTTTLRNAIVAAELLGDTPRLAGYVDRLAELEPDNPDTLRLLARVLYAQGRRAEAAEVYARLVLTNGARADDYYALGVCHFDLERWDAAAAAWRQALNVAPGHASALRGLPVAYWRLGDYNAAWEAVALAREARVRLDPSFVDTLARDSGRRDVPAD